METSEQSEFLLGDTDETDWLYDYDKQTENA